MWSTVIYIVAVLLLAIGIPVVVLQKLEYLLAISRIPISEKNQYKKPKSQRGIRL